MTLEQSRIEAEQLCREIMGDDYIAHAEMTNAFGWQYNSRQINRLEREIPKLDVLKELKANKYVLLPTPPIYCDARMIQSLELDGTLRHAAPDPDYMTGEILWAGDWLAMRKGLYPRSRNKVWEKQVKLLSDREFVPSYTQTMYVLVAFRFLRGRELLQEEEVVRTSSGWNHSPATIDLMTDLVCHSIKDVDRETWLGIAAAYKLAA